MAREITFSLTAHDDGYNVRDWFRWDMTGDHPIDQAEAAATVDEAKNILRDAYLGPDVDGVEVRWQVHA